MSKKDKEEIALSEIAVIAGVHRQTAYQAVKSGEIAGGRLIAGKLWVAPRGEVMKYKRKREREAQLRREEAERNPMFGVGEVVRHGMAGVSEVLFDMRDRLT